MIKTFIDKLLGKTPANPRARKPQFGKREDVPASVHGIDPELVDHRAVDVVRTLKDAGYEAYVVGGAVRDLLLGLRPKDFDVATNATPEQVKHLFRRAFIIGKRFRIVHVVYGRGRENEVIEVSTFRAFLDNSAAEQVSGNERTSKAALAHMQHAVDASGRVLRDNVWGPQDQDATRRDFTVNAMYYDPETQVVVDFHKGFHAFPALQEAIDEVFDQRIGDVSGRGKLAADMREIWVMQPRFDKRSGATPFGMVAQARFRAGFDFMRLRADVGEVEESLANWWQEFQHADDARREDLVAQAKEEQRQRQKNNQPVVRRAPQKAVAEAGAVAAPPTASTLDGMLTEGDGAAKKRRRRRRKPAGAAGAEAADE